MQTFQHFHIEFFVKPRETCRTNGYNKLWKETSSPSPLKRVSPPPQGRGRGVQIHVLKIHLLQIHLLQIHLLQIHLLQIHVLQIHLLQIQSMFDKSNPIQSTQCFTICLLFCFPQIAYVKMQFFSWQCPFQMKLLLFQTKESAKCTFAAKAGSGKPAFLHALSLETFILRAANRPHYK